MADPGDGAGRFVTFTPRLRARRELAAFLRRLAALGVAIGLLLVAGTLGFAVLEDVSLWGGFVWTLDTIATVGSIPNPDSTGGQVLRVLLIVLGVGTLFYALVTVTEFFVAGHLSGLLDDRRAQRMIDDLSDHYLICGFGRVGRQVARDLQAANAACVVIDGDPENHELARAMGAPFIEGSPSNDENLRQAGLERARGVIACMDSDAENIFTSLSARELRGDIFIVARAAAEDSESKLKRAGANRVISPYKTSGTEMARLALHPQVSGVVAVDPEYRMEEIGVGEGCPGDGQTVGEVRGGAIIVAVRQHDGTFHFQPPGDHQLDAGDVVVAMGTIGTMDRLEGLLAPGGAQDGSEAEASS